MGLQARNKTQHSHRARVFHKNFSHISRLNFLVKSIIAVGHQSSTFFIVYLLLGAIIETEGYGNLREKMTELQISAAGGGEGRGSVTGRVQTLTLVSQDERGGGG